MTRIVVLPGRQVVTAAGHHYGGDRLDVDAARAAELIRIGAATAAQESAPVAGNALHERIRAELRTDAERSDRAIARAVGCDHKTVAAVRREGGE